MAQKGGKKSPQKGAGKKNWMKVAIPVFLILIMVLSIFTILTGNNNVTTDDTTTDIRFNSLADGLAIIPPGAQYVRYADLQSNAALGNWTMSNLNNSLPDPKVFGAQPQKDVVAIYPDGYFSDGDYQWVSITDFGQNAKINVYSTVTYRGITMGNFSPFYTYTLERPIISGFIENVADVALYWSNPGNRSSYDDYSPLLQQLKGYPVNASQAQLSVVGTTSLLNVSDRYYAGITPASDGKYYYQAVLHLNKTLNETEKQQYKTQYELLGINFMGFDSYTVNYQNDYMIIFAKGNMTTCLTDMSNSWRFLKG